MTHHDQSAPSNKKTTNIIFSILRLGLPRRPHCHTASVLHTRSQVPCHRNRFHLCCKHGISGRPCACHGANASSLVSETGPTGRTHLKARLTSRGPSMPASHSSFRLKCHRPAITTRTPSPLPISSTQNPANQTKPQKASTSKETHTGNSATSEATPQTLAPAGAASCSTRATRTTARSKSRPSGTSGCGTRARHRPPSASSRPRSSASSR